MVSFCLIICLFCWHFCLLSHFKIIWCIVKSLIFCWNTTEKTKFEKSCLSTRVWVPKPVYQCLKWPGYVSGCEYRDLLNDMRRDRLVCGINHERTQQPLLIEGSTLSLKKALDIALSLESAISQIGVIQSGCMNSKTETPILKVSNTEVKKSYRCDRNQVAKSCPFLSKECFYCLNRSHKSKVCWKKATVNNEVKVNNVIQVKESSTKKNDDKFYDIYSLSMLRNLPLVEEANISGTDIKMEVSTGASRSTINMETYNNIKCKSDLLVRFMYIYQQQQ